MKRFTFISMLVLMVPLAGIGQNQNAMLDDIYFKPSDASKIQKTQVNKQKPTYKNGAKEIVYIDRENSTANSDSTVLAQANDSIYTDSLNNTGYYLNGFKGTKSDLEYAERIRRFHSPKYTVFIGDPSYNDIYFLNDNDWNVYVDGSYAYVTPTWTNPYWWNYNYGPMYGGWGYNNFYSPYYGYGGWNYYPWSYNNFYGYGYPYYGGYYGGYYGSYYGWGSPYYYGYGDYYGYGGYYGYGDYGNWYTHSFRDTNPAHNEANRRNINNPNGKRYGDTNSAAQTIGGSSFSAGSRNPYTVVSGIGSRDKNQATVINGTASRPATTTLQATSRPSGNGIGLVRTGGSRNTSGLYQNYTNANSNTGSRPTSIGTSTTINTRPRTATVYSNSNNSEISRGTNSSESSTRIYSTGSSRPGSSTNSGSRSTTYSTPTYSSGSRTSTYSAPTYNSGTRSSSPSSSGSYNSSSPSYSSPSYNSGSSSSSSYSSGSNSSSSGGSRSSSGGGNSAGSRR